MRLFAVLLVALPAALSPPAPAERPATAPPAAQTQAPAAAAQVLALADQVLEEVSRLRGLPSKSPFSRQIHDEATLRGHIAERLRIEYPGDRLQREQRLLVALGLLPAGCDLEKEVGDLYASQTAGYYDPERRTLYLSDRLEEPLLRPTLVHEITHALQDQHFRIERLIGRGRADDDARMAGMALVEGDATAVMLAGLMPQGAHEAWVETARLFGGGLFETIAASLSPGAPRFLVEVLSFPYKNGAPFVGALYASGGWEAVSGAYARPPASTEQILHPERYAPVPDEPTAVGISAFPGRLAGLPRHYDLVLGEFVTRLVLGTRLDADAAARAAEGWDGDRVALYAGDGGELLVWLSAWDSEQEAAEFAAALRQRPQERVEARGERVLYLRGDGRFPEKALSELAGELWRGWR
jgi:hypothetical protein